MAETALLELNPADLGTLDLGGQWVTYVNLLDDSFLPTRIKIVNDEYAWDSSFLVKGHGATMPGKIRDLRGAGKKPVIVERGDRYYVFVSPP